MPVIYARHEDNLLQNELKAVAANAKLPVATVVEIMLGDSMGLPPHPLRTAVRQAITARKTARRKDQKK